MKTSVVIAVHNGEKTIKRCLKSVLVNRPDEVIVVDDGSTDNTSNIVKKYPVKLIRFKKNQGLVIAEKTGIEKAKGDIIFMTNADCMVPFNWIEIHLELHKKADCVGCWTRFDIEDKTSRDISLPAYNCSFKRKVLEKIGNLNSNLESNCEDTEFFLRAHHNNFSIVNDSSIPVLHIHPLSYTERLKREWKYGLRLGELIRKYPHYPMSKRFLLLPIYWFVLFLREIKSFIKNLLLKLTESTGKFIGFITS